MNWDNIVVKIGGEEIKGITFIEYDPPPPRWQYYTRRGNKYFFRSMSAKMVITSDDGAMKILKIGDRYDFNFNHKNQTNEKDPNS